MSDITANNERIAELEERLSNLKLQAAREQEQKEKAKISAVRELMDSDEDPSVLLKVCQEHAINSVSELVRIFRMKGGRKSINRSQAEAVICWLRSNPRATAEEIVAAVGCDRDLPRKMAADKQLISWGNRRAKRYAVR